MTNCAPNRRQVAKTNGTLSAANVLPVHPREKKGRLLQAALFRSLKSSIDQASKRLRADLLRNWMRREVSSTMAPDCTSWVSVRDTVSIVSPR